MTGAHETERREVVVDSVLQAHQLQQYLTISGIDWHGWPLSVTQTRIVVTATPEQWTGIDGWLQRIGAPASPAEVAADYLRQNLPGVTVEVAAPPEDLPYTTLADTGNFIVRVPKEES